MTKNTYCIFNERKIVDDEILETIVEQFEGFCVFNRKTFDKDYKLKHTFARRYKDLSELIDEHFETADITELFNEVAKTLPNFDILISEYYTQKSLREENING